TPDVGLFFGGTLTKKRWVMQTKVVNVADGRLTLFNSIDVTSEDTPVDFVEITPVRTITVPAFPAAHVVKLASGEDFHMALIDDGTVWVWGNAPSFQSNRPRPLAGVTGATDISASDL